MRWKNSQKFVFLYAFLTKFSFPPCHCIPIPAYFSHCTFHIRTDFTRFDVAGRIGPDIYPTEFPTSKQRPPVVLTHINKTIVTMYHQRSAGMQEILSTYQSDVTYQEIPSRHNVCTVVQLFSYWLPSGDPSFQIFFAIQQVLDSWVNPHFIFFEDTNLGKNPILKFPIVSHISTTAVFGVFNSDVTGGETNLLRWVKGNHGSYHDLVGSQISGFSSSRELIITWEILNSNLAGSKICTGYTHQWHKEDFCSFYTPSDRVARMHRFSVNDCVKSSFLSRKNVSATLKPKMVPDTVGYIIAETMPFSKRIKYLVGCRMSFSFAWIKYGMRTESYTFSVFLEPKETVTKANLSAILLPFDVGIWLLILVIGSSLALLLFLLLGRGTRALLWFLGSLLDQSDLLFWSKPNFKLLPSICFPPIAGWTMVSLFLGFAYKGELFSCMTSTPKPDVPKNLSDLLRSEIPLITTTYFVSLPNKVPRAPLEFVCRDLLETLNAEGLHSIASALLRRTIFVPAFYKGVEIAENISRLGKVETCANPHAWNCSSSEGSVELGNKFAVISVKPDIASFSNFLNHFGAKFIQLENDTPNPISLKMPWIAYYNGVYGIFSRHFGALVESGIHSWWRRNSHVAGQVRLLVQNKFKIKAGNESGSIPGLVQQLWVTGRVNMLGDKGDLGGIEIDVLLPPFIIWSAALGFAWVVFLSEFLTHTAIVAVLFLQQEQYDLCDIPMNIWSRFETLNCPIINKDMKENLPHFLLKEEVGSKFMKWCYRMPLGENVNQKYAISSNPFDRGFNYSITNFLKNVISKVNATVYFIPSDGSCDVTSELKINGLIDSSNKESTMIATTINGYKYLSCYADNYVSFQLYFAPFQPVMWLVLIISLFMVICVLSLSIKWRRDKFSTPAWLYTFGTLLAQCYVPGRKVEIPYFRIVFSIWCLMLVILSNAYTGLITTELNSPFPASHPEVWDDLACIKLPSKVDNSTTEHPTVKQLVSYVKLLWKLLRRRDKLPSLVPDNCFHLLSLPLKYKFDYPSWPMFIDFLMGQAVLVDRRVLTNSYLDRQVLQIMNLLMPQNYHHTLDFNYGRKYNGTTELQRSVEKEVVDCGRKSVFISYEYLVDEEYRFLSKHYAGKKFYKGRDVIGSGSLFNGLAFSLKGKRSRLLKYFWYLVDTGVYGRIEKELGDRRVLFRTAALIISKENDAVVPLSLDGTIVTVFIFEAPACKKSCPLISDITYRKIYSRHNVCTVVQLFSYWLPSGDVSLKVFIAIRQVLDSWVIPHFIFFEDTNLGKNSVLKFPLVLHISTPAVFGVFNSDITDGQTNLIRLSNTNRGSWNDLVGPRISEFPSPPELTMTWKQLNSNLPGTKICMAYTHKWHKEEFCSFNLPSDRVARIHRFSVNDCVRSSFLSRKNMSLTRTSTLDTVSFIISETMTHSKMIKERSGSKKFLSFGWIKYGVRMETYTFSVFLEPKEILAKANFAAILLPFDVGIWLLILLVGSTLVIIMLLVSGRGTRAWLWFLGNLLDQSDLKVNFKFLPSICFPAITGWTMASLFLGFAYKGELFSCITSTPRPDVPRNLNDLLQSKIPLITTTYFTSMITKVPRPPLRFLCRDMLEILDPGAEGLRNIAAALLRRTMFVPSFYKGVEIAENISRLGQVETCANPRVWNCSESGDKGSIQIGNTFAVISVKEDIVTFSNYLNHFGAKFMQVENDTPNPVTFKMPWIVYYNGVYDIFSRHFGALIESGIHSWWRRNSHVAGQVRLLLQNKFKIKARHESGSIPGLVQQLFVSGRVNIFDAP
ncbi:hypothetical protein Fcan01_25745 [Folsomia candida]|uniref:Uncharacterized protein n=1 Tax=Folsomia candida TaxID=158441 RepID=A0A226D462_FOLCA|nr:hypothetical protein Fcan01_25745 [Folsomia candida]